MTKLNAKAARPYTDRNGQEQTAWTNLGVALPNRNGEGYTLLLDAMPAPVDGQYKIVLMPPKEQNQRPDPGAPLDDGSPF